MKLILFALMVGFVSCQIKTGGVSKKDPKDPMFQKPAQVAATYTDNQNSVSLSARYGQNYEVVAASTQVVAGVLYKLTLKFTSADSNVDGRVREWKVPNLDLEGSKSSACMPLVETLCDVVVLEQSWLNYTSLNGTPDCRAVDQQRTGGYRNADSTSPAVQAAAAFAVDAMNKRSNSMNRNILIEVVSAQQQVVAGMNYKLVLSVGVSSSCRNDGTTGVTLLKCPVDQRKMMHHLSNSWLQCIERRCDVVVWDQPWRTPRYELTSFSCQ